MTGFDIREVESSGRGVYATRAVPAGAVLWRDPIVAFPRQETDMMDSSGLRDYYFLIDGTAFICLGNGSLINHSADHNCTCDLDKESRELIFWAARPIAAGEQITIDYEWDEYPWEASQSVVVHGEQP